MKNKKPLAIFLFILSGLCFLMQIVGYSGSIDEEVNPFLFEGKFSFGQFIGYNFLFLFAAFFFWRARLIWKKSKTLKGTTDVLDDFPEID